MSKATPGPWAFDGPNSNIHVRQATDPNIRICFMTSDGPTRANARLIAAAPELLAALQHVRSIIVEAALTGFNCLDGDWVEKLFASQALTHAAVKKATGPLLAEERTDGDH